MGYKKNPDYNGETEYGVAFTQFNVKWNGTFGTRQDTYSRFVKSFENHSKLTVYANSTVDKIVLTNDKKIDYLIFHYNNLTYKSKAHHEIILCAGTFRTPLIMRSGIGDCNEISKFGIDCIVNLGGVGKNLMDHVIPYASWSLREQDPQHKTVMDINVIFDQVVSEVNGLLKPKYQFQRAINSIKSTNHILNYYFNSTQFTPNLNCI